MSQNNQIPFDNQDQEPDIRIEDQEENEQYVFQNSGEGMEEEINDDENNVDQIEEEYDHGNPEYSSHANDLLNLEREFQIMHDHDSANKLIEIYKDLEDFINVRRIRETLLEFNTLSENQWMDWITDEKSLAKTSEEKKAVLKLFDKALEDVLYYDIAKFAVKYVKYLYSEGIVRKQGVNITIGKLINNFCYDFNRGSKFFKKLREFESENKESANELEKTKATIRNLYERQFKLPLADIDNTFQEYLGWEQNQVEKKRLAAIYNGTYQDITLHLDIDEKVEEVIDPFDPENFKAVMKEILGNESINLEKKINLLERCIEKNYMEPLVWEVYVEFADTKIESNVSLERIYRRALKNCSNNIDFATKYLRILEKQDTDLEELRKKALMMLFNFTEAEHYYQLRLQLCEVYVHALNAKIDAVKGNLSEAKEEIVRFRLAMQEAIEFFSSEQSKENQVYISNLWLFKAHIETYTTKDKKEMNTCMDHFVKQNGSQYLAWYQYVLFEQALGRPSTVRQILKRGCEYTKDDIHSMFKFAIEYERKFGSLKDLENMEKKYKEKLIKLAQEGELVQEQTIQPILFQPSERANEKADKKREKQKENKKEKKGLKRRNNEFPVPQKNETQYQELKHDVKKPRITVPKKDEKIVEEIKMEPMSKINTSAQKEKPTMEEEKQDQGRSELQTEKENATNEPIAYPDYLDTRNTVFVKGFPLSFEDEDVKAIFPNSENITGCRTVKNKGFAYVDFVNPEEASEACKNDGVSIDGKILSVALSDPPKKGKEDNKTIFINNLPFSVTKQILEAAFSVERKHIKEIRIPLKQDGSAKGYAYLTFDTERAADDAVEKHKNLAIGGRNVRVEHADSSKKHEQVLKALHVALLKGLNFKASEQDIRNFFKDFDIKQVKIIVDSKSGKSKGFGFVEFNTSEDLRRALSIPEPIILSRPFTIIRSDRPITEEGNKDQKKNQTISLSKKDAQKQEEVDGDKTPPRKSPQPIEKKEEPPKAGAMKSNQDFRALLFKK